MKKVLLISPPEAGRGDYSTPPLNLLYLAAALRKNGIEVSVVDGYIEGWEGVDKKIDEYRPDIVGITCHTYARTKAIRIATMVKNALPDAIVVVGGAHSTIMHEQILKNYPVVDIAVIGEGEKTFLEICQGKRLSEIDGIAYRENGRVIVNKERQLIKDLDEVAFPAWDLIDISRYPSDGSGVYNEIDIGKEPCIPVVFSRGCIGSCIFCSDRFIWKIWRHRSAKNMADELELLHKKYGVKRFAFSDDMFTANKKTVLELCDEIIKRGLKIVFEIVTRTDCLDMNILKALKTAGCYKICFGIETGSPELLKRMKKPIDIKVSERAIEMTKSVGIKTQALLIVGSLGETKDTINQTIDFLKRVKPDEIGLANGLRVLPGTELYEHAKSRGFIDDSFWLTPYNWKIYTAENSRLRLNIFCDAVNRRKKLSKFEIMNVVAHRRAYTRAMEEIVKAFLIRVGLLKRKRKSGKYEVAY